MKFNLKNFPELYLADRSNLKVQKWKESFEKELRERRNLATEELQLIKEILGE